MSDRAVHRVRPRALPLLLACLATLVALTGCSSLSGAGDKGFVSGDGQIRTLAPEERDAPVELSGRDLAGDPLDLADLRGSVVVVNVWGSWCGPCDAEAPDLVEVSQDYAEAGDPVQFVGVNHRDSIPNAQAFERKHGVPYPSLQDDGGRTLAQLQGLATARPTTMVLDGQGRLAARVNGQVDASTLRGLVDDVLAGETG